MTGCKMYHKPDVHMHSVFSDGTDTPGELLQKVKTAGIDLFSLTDHDTAEGCAEVQKLLQPGDPRFLCGIEFSCKDKLGKYHVLGYCYNAEKNSIKEAVTFSHNMRIQKMLGRFVFLKEQFGFTFTDSEKQTLMSLKNPGKPHFAALLLEKGYVRSREEGFDIFRGYHGSESNLSPEEAIDAIYRADGLPVLAHGILADGSKLLSEEEIDQRVERFKREGLMGLECYYGTFTTEQTDIMLHLAEKYDLFVTAGSDYHGKNKPIALGQMNRPDPEKLRRFYSVIEMLL